MRDPARERALPKAAQDLIQRYYVAFTSSGRAGRIRWENVYAALEEGDPLAIPEIEESIQRMLEHRKKVAGWRAAEREEKKYNSQAVEIDPQCTTAELDLLKDSTLVWMYHGTSSKLLPKIMTHGLRPDAPKRTWSDATRGYVYLTVEPGSWSKPAGDARFYAERAAGHWGGDPVVLRLIVPWGWLESDADDAELSCGRVQYRTTETIPPTAIMEINGERIDHAATKPRRRRA